MSKLLSFYKNSLFSLKGSHNPVVAFHTIAVKVSIVLIAMFFMVITMVMPSKHSLLELLWIVTFVLVSILSWLYFHTQSSYIGKIVYQSFVLLFILIGDKLIYPKAGINNLLMLLSGLSLVFYSFHERKILIFCASIPILIFVVLILLDTHSNSGTFKFFLISNVLFVLLIIVFFLGFYFDLLQTFIQKSQSFIQANGATSMILEEDLGGYVSTLMMQGLDGIPKGAYSNIYLWEFDGEKFKVNPSFYQKHGIEQKGCLLRDFREIVAEKHKLKFEFLNFNSKRKTDLESFEFEILTENGTYWYELKANNYQTNNGEFGKWSGVFIDINNRVSHELNLLRFYDDVEHMFELSPFGIIVVSEGQLEFVNGKFLEMSMLRGFELEEFGKTVKLYPDEELEYQDFLNQNWSHENEEKNYEYILERKDKTKISVLLMSRHIGFKGKDAQLIVLNEYSARKKFINELNEREFNARKQEALAKIQKKLFEDILYYLPVMIMVYGEDGSLFLTNKYLEDMFGWKALDLKDLESLKITVPDQVNESLLKKSLTLDGKEWVTYQMIDRDHIKHVTQWTGFDIEGGFYVRIGIDVSENVQNSQKYLESIEELKSLNKKLLAREESIAKNQELIKAINIQLYDQNKIFEENENKYKTLTQVAFEAIFLLENGKIVECNETARKLLMISESEDMDFHFVDMVVPSHRSIIAKVIGEELVVDNTEITLIKSNGSLFYGELRTKKLIYKNKNLIVLSVRDITFRKRVEMEAKSNEANIRNLMDNIDIGLFLKLSNGEIFYNKTLLRFLRLENIESKLDIVEYIHPDFRGEVENIETGIDNGDETYWAKDIAIFSQDQERFEVNLTLVKTIYKNKTALMFTFLDINQRKEAERKLQVAYSYQNAILNSGDISYWASNKKFELLFANNFHYKLNNKFFNKDILIGSDVKGLLHPLLNSEELERHFFEVFQGANLSRVIKSLDEKGEVHWLEFMLSPIYELEEILGVLVRTRDITDSFTQIERIRLSEERLREAEIIAKVGSWEESNESIYWSTGMFKVFSKTRNYKPHKNSLVDVLGTENAERLAKHYVFAMDSDKPIERQYMVDLDEEVRWFRLAIYAPKKNASIFKGTVHDITEAKQAELRIKQNEKLLNTTIENLPVIFHLFDHKGLSLKINDQLRRFFEVSEYSTPVGRYNILFDRKLFGEGNINVVAKAFEGEKVFLRNIEVDLSKVIGRKGMENATGFKYLDSIFTPIFDSNGVLTNVMYLGIDTTEAVLRSKELEKSHLEIIEATKQVSEFKLVALRSAMNPHFIFNVLNSIQYFITKNDKIQALTYLSMFSKLVRMILENSMHNKISLNQEITILKYYIDLENLRFENKFDVNYDIDENLLDDEILVPSMIIQPFVENSIVHGLANKKEGKGMLYIGVEDQDDYLMCTIEDNGVGRDATAKNRQSDHKSLGTKVTEERLKIINKFDQISVNVIDLFDENNYPKGTRTVLKIKIN